MKVCCHCGKKRRLTSFYINRGHRDGLNSRCKDCDKRLAKEWAKAHPDRIKARGRAVPSEKIRAKDKAYYAANREKVKAQRRKYYLANRRACLARVRRYMDIKREAEAMAA